MSSKTRTYSCQKQAHPVKFIFERKSGEKYTSIFILDKYPINVRIIFTKNIKKLKAFPNCKCLLSDYCY